MRRSHSVSETSVGLFAFLDVLMSTMGSLILVLMIVSPKIRQEKMAKAANEAARDIVKVEPAPTPAPVPVVAPPRETIDLNAKFAARVAELLGQADNKRRTADEKQRGLASQRERSDKIRAEREQLERDLAQLRATKDTTLASVQDLSAEGLRVESELAKRGSRLRKIQDQIAHESTEYSFVAYDGVSGTTRRPILIECADDQIKFPQENITLTAADISGFTTSTNPVRAGAEALLDYWSTHSKPDDPKPYVLIVVRPSGTLAYYRTRNLLQRMNTPFGYELLSEDQKLAVPTPDPAAVTACRQAVDQAITKRESVFDSVFANRGGLRSRDPWRRGAGGSRSDAAGGSGTGNSPNSPFDDPFDLTSNGTKGPGTNGTGKAGDGNAVVASGNTMAGGTAPGGVGSSGPATGGGETPSGRSGGNGAGNGIASGGVTPGGTGLGSVGSTSVGPGGVNSGNGGSAGVGSGGIGSGTGAPGPFVSGSNALASGRGGGSGPGELVGGGTVGAGSVIGGAGSGVPSDPTAGVANGDLKNGISQKGGDAQGTESTRPVATLAGSAGEDTVGTRVRSSGEGQPDVGPSNRAFELLPPPGANRSGGSGDDNVAEHPAAGELGFELAPGLSQSNDSQPGRASLGAGSDPSTSVLQTGNGTSQSGMNNAGLGSGGVGASGLEGGGSGAPESSAGAGGQPGSPAQLSPAMASSDATQGESGLPGGSPSGGSPGAESGGEQGQPSASSADQAGGSGMPSFGQLTDGAPNGGPVRHRWGYSSPQASIGFEHDLTIWIGTRTLVIGGQRPIPISRAESVQRLAAIVVPAIDREARAWGRPPDHLYWVPNIKFVVSPGGNVPYERLRPIIERHGLVSSVDYCLEMDSPRQTLQSWVQ